MTRIRPPRRGGFPDGPGMLASAGLLATFFEDPIEWFVQLRHDWGDLVGLRAGARRSIVCFDVDLLEQVLVARGRMVRPGTGPHAACPAESAGAPVRVPAEVEQLADAIAAITGDVLDGWPEVDGVVAVAHDCAEISLRVTGVGLLRAELDADDRQRLHDAVRDLDDGYRLLRAPGGRRLVEHGLTPAARRLRDARAQVRTVFAGEPGAGDEPVLVLLAGHDATAVALGWCLAMLAAHPDEQRRARAEVDQVLAERVVTAGDVPALRRVRAVVDETLRLHPPVYATTRAPIEPLHLSSGHVLPAGTDVVVPIGGIHRDPRLWTDPSAFRPDRFIDEETVRARPAMAYLPFGAGEHRCIGAGFALQELVIVVATILQRYELSATPDSRLEPHVGFLRRPAGELPLQVRRRPDVVLG